ncbi:ribosomal protein L27 [Chloropicon primus]|uniref:Ribosomal protein L27 n=1 Tax=Chloropicon primus TaxID=1764295 RepID=A0A5B8MDR4_9CHLO|nr:ribosomal protein L27 [Chloropicon primus]UPQ96992.1 ribosomal protein L27 [Chloropicon primus]|eukprot:QDZ17775.1 ribosomal protein L27 [Chloropicon primus]
MSGVVSGILNAFARGRRIVPRKGWKTLDAKRAKKGYVKGKGVKSVGKHTKYGGYTILAHKIPRYIVPDLNSFELKPYVARNFKPFFKN